jgi:hypothetical protein
VASEGKHEETFQRTRLEARLPPQRVAQLAVREASLVLWDRQRYLSFNYSNGQWCSFATGA